jgi:hypothetical protein
MLIAAAVCPHPPLLVPDASGRSGPGDAELGRLRTACHEAVAALWAQRPDLIAVVGGASQTTEYPPRAIGSLCEFGVPFAVGEDPQGQGGQGGQGGQRGQPVLPLSLTIGRWLLTPQLESTASGDRRLAIALRGINTAAPTVECLRLGEKLAALAPRVALLVMGDGPGRRARGVPGARDGLADRYDERVAAALAEADPGSLAALDPRQDGELLVAGRAAWQVLAGAAAHDRFAAELRYAAAPFEVTYFVASWRRAH